MAHPLSLVCSLFLKNLSYILFGTHIVGHLNWYIFINVGEMIHKIEALSKHDSTR